MNNEEKLGVNQIDLKYNTYIINKNKNNYDELIRTIYEYCCYMYNNIFVPDDFYLDDKNCLVKIDKSLYIPIYTNKDYSLRCSCINTLRMFDIVKFIINNSFIEGLIVNYSDNYDDVYIGRDMINFIYDKASYIIDLSYDSNVGIKVTFEDKYLSNIEKVLILNFDINIDKQILLSSKDNNMNIIIRFQNENINKINNKYLDEIFDLLVELSRNNRYTIYTEDIDLYIKINTYFESYCNNINNIALKQFKEKYH